MTLGPDPVRLTRRTDLFTRRCGASILLLGRGEEQLHRLQGVTAGVWVELDTPHTLSELIAVAQGAAVGVGGDVVDQAVRDAVEAMSAAGLVEVGPHQHAEDDDAGRQ